jgi:hypothetical protein
MSVPALEEIDFVGKLDELQMAIPGMDGYRAEKLTVSISGGVEFTDVTQREDVEFVKGFRLGQEVELKIRATVTRKGFTLAPRRDEMTDDKTTYGVALKVHSVDLT